MNDDDVTIRWHSAILIDLVACGIEGGAVIAVYGDVVVSRIEVVLASAEAQHQQRQVMQREDMIRWLSSHKDGFVQIVDDFVGSGYQTSKRFRS